MTILTGQLKRINRWHAITDNLNTIDNGRKMLNLSLRMRYLLYAQILKSY